ncbi:MAG: phosphotransferase [Acidimicrobiales bacterium]
MRIANLPAARKRAAAAARRLVAGEVVAVAPHGRGHIHETWLVTTSAGGSTTRTVVQRLNGAVFPDPMLVAATAARVATHQHGRLAAARCPDAPRRALTVLAAHDGRPFVMDGDGACWRGFLYVEGAASLAPVRSPAGAAQAAGVAARFLDELSDLGGPPITEAIPGFRDFRGRLAALDAVAGADPVGRGAGCGAAVEAVRAAATVVDEVDAARATGHLPERTVHNDAKADNVLADEATGEGLCMVDLDTVAPGTVLADVGDLVRSTVAAVDEDDPEPPVALRGDHLEAVLGAYLDGAGHLLVPTEVALLPLAGPLMAWEAATRFLTDHLAGDVYFAVDRPGHNLDRARAQLRLLDALVVARPATADLVGRLAAARGLG